MVASWCLVNEKAGARWPQENGYVPAGTSLKSVGTVDGILMAGEGYGRDGVAITSREYAEQFFVRIGRGTVSAGKFLPRE